MDSKLQGRRVSLTSDDAAVFFLRGDYGKMNNGTWWGRAPHGGIANLANHTVVEHEDGTITVSPSILIENGNQERSWHGYLERGIWRTV